MTKALVLSFTVFFGTNIIFKGAYMDMFFILFVILFFLDVADIVARVRVERYRNNFISRKFRAGISQRISDYLTLFVFAIVMYYVIGAITGAEQECGFICMTLSIIPSTLVSLYVLGTFSSIVENNIEMSMVKGIKPRPTTLFFAKTIGILYHKISNKFMDKMNDEK